MIWKYFLAWFPMIIIAIANGLLRELGYKPYVGDLTAHWLSTVTLILFFSLYVWVIGRKWKICSLRQSWLIGVMWLMLTIFFEFGFGHFIMGHPWSKLLHDYNLFEGRVWILILLTILAAPYISYKMQNKHETPDTEQYARNNGG